MAITIERLKDTTRTIMIKVVGTDISGETNTTIITPNTLFGALNTDHTLLYPNGISNPKVGTELDYYDLTFYRLWYDVNNTGSGLASIFWKGNGSSVSDAQLLAFSWSGDFNSEGNWASIPNSNKNKPGVKGDVVLKTKGITGFSIIIEFVKDNLHFNSGEIESPNVFNYGAYGITP
jgi:hypothetical protein